VNFTNPYIMQAIVDQRIADLRRAAAARTEPTARPGRKRRLKRRAKATQTVPAVQAQQR
jgi:hypothetical protein